MPLMLLIFTEGCSLFGSCEAEKSGFVFFGASRKLFCVMEELLDFFVVVPWFLVVVQCFPNCGLQLQGSHKIFNKNHLATKKKKHLVVAMIKTKCRSQLNVESKPRVAMSPLCSRLEKLCSNKQAQLRHQGQSFLVACMFFSRVSSQPDSL
uniref:Putative secreted protein n=1 Tax=Ixodes ricinus TaxID=34613 RepID=A0A6B0UVM0_IXORI